MLKTSTDSHRLHKGRKLELARSQRRLRGVRGGEGTCHRLISTPRLHLIIRNLPLLTFPTLKLIRRRVLRRRPLGIKNIHLL